MIKINSILLFCLSTFVFTACSSNSEPLQTSDTQQMIDKSGYKCERVVKTGSNIPSKRCTTTVQREAERKAARENIADKNFKNATIGNI